MSAADAVAAVFPCGRIGESCVMPEEPTPKLPNKLFPGAGAQPSTSPVDEMVESAEIGPGDQRYDQENGAGVDNIDGGGEYPDPDTPPAYDAGAPGPELVGHQEHGKGQFNEVQPAVGAAPEGRQRPDEAD